MNARLPSAAVAPRILETEVSDLRHWTPGLLSLRLLRPAGFGFVAGHYARLGLSVAADEILWRPFSMVSGPDDDFLEFFAVLVPDGEFSRRLGNIRTGDRISIERSSYGFLTIDQLAEGEDLWLLASGTGLGPFVAILRDAATWRRFRRLIVVHSVRHVAELAYRDEIAAIAAAAEDPAAPPRLHYLPVVTRDAGATALQARIPSLIDDGRLEQAVGRKLDPAYARVMVCGNPELTRDMRQLLSARGFAVSRRRVPGQMAFEKYW